MSRQLQIAIVFLSVFVYIGLLFWLYDAVGNMLLALSFLPVALAGWLMGLRVSFFISFLTFAGTGLYLRYIAGVTSGISSVIVTFFALLLVGIVVGRLRDLQERSRQELETRRDMERALRESEERYVDLYENANDIIFTVDLAGDFTSANRVAFAALGYDPEDMAGTNLFDILTPESSQFAAGMLQRAVAEGSDLSDFQPWELEARKKDGSTLIVEVRTRLIWDEGEVSGFQGIARDITERKRAEERSLIRERFLECLSDISQRMLRADELSDILPSILHQLGDTVGVDRVYLFKNRRGDEGELHCSMEYEWSASGVEPRIDNPEFQNSPYVESGFGRWTEVLGEGRAIAEQVSTFPEAERALLTSMDIHSILIVPLFVFDRWYGFIGFDSDDPDRVWQQVEVDLLSAATSDVASVIEREQTIRRARALAEAAATFTSTLDFDQVLDRILTQVDRVVPNDAANIMLIQGDVARIVGWHGYEQFGVESFISSVEFDVDDMAILQRMVVVHEPVIVPDTREHPDWIHLPDQDWLRSYAAAPIRVKGKVVGFLNVDSAVPQFFSQSDAQTLQVFADYAAIALDNARLFEAANQRVIELEAVRHAALSLTSSLELEGVLEVILESALRFLPDAQNSHVFLYRGRVLGFGAALWADGHRGQPVAMPRPNGLTYTVAREGEMIVVPAMRSHPLFEESPPDWDGAIVGLPLKIGGRVVGVMNISYQKPHDFSENELRILRLFGDHAAIAIENARLFESEQRQTRRLALLAEVARVVATTWDQDLLLHEVADIIYRHFGYQSVMFFTPDEEGAKMVMRGRAGERLGPPEAITPGVYWQPIDLGIVGHVVQSGRSYLASDVSRDPFHYSPDQVVVRSEVCVPILEDGQVIGVIDVESDRQGTFGPQDRSLLEAVADTVSIGLRNARLFTEARTRAEELAAALARLEELDRLKDQFIQNVSHELRSPLALIRGYAEMLDTGQLGAVLPEQQKPLSIIARRSRMLGDLVSDITLILEAEASPPESDVVQLDEMAQAAVEDFQITARQEGLALRADITSDLSPVEIPTNYMRRVFDNLLGNAVKFTPSGGEITVHVRQAGGDVILEVSDTGIGISPEELARVFDRFYQVDGSARRRYGGVGLGLSLVKELVEAYGGSVGVASELDVGTTFTVKLPALTD